MKAKTPLLLLTLALLIAPSTACAQLASQFSYSFGLTVTSSDPKLLTSSIGANINSEATGGQNDVHAGTVKFIAVVTFTPSAQYPAPPTSLSIPYKLVNESLGSVDLAGKTPPSGSGKGYGYVANALSDTGTIYRGSNAKSSYYHAGPLTQNKWKSVTVPESAWVEQGGVFKLYVSDLESSTLSTSARIDAYSTPPNPIPDEYASGYAGQAIYPQ